MSVEFRKSSRFIVLSRAKLRAPLAPYSGTQNAVQIHVAKLLRTDFAKKKTKQKGDNGDTETLTNQPKMGTTKN